MKIVIRAGGIGSRLWPMSRINSPKQFQNVVGEKTMIRATYERIAPLLKSPADLFISVNRNFEYKIEKEIPEMEMANIIVETDTRNTGPAMCLEVCFLEKYCSKNDIVASLPSDDFISDSRSFRNLLLMSEQFLLENPEYILTPAIMPNYPDTGYTYFKAGKNLAKSGEEAVYSVAKVVEKPNIERCQSIIKTGVYYCHTGMYLWQLGEIIKLLQKFQPDMYEICSQIVNFMPDRKKSEKIQELYSQLEKNSIESALTDRVEKIAMSVSNKIGWSDLGKWHVVHRILKNEADNNVIKGSVFINDSSNNLIYSTVDKKVIVVNDIKNLAIVDTNDALFITSLKKSADAKDLVKKLKESGMEQYL